MATQLLNQQSANGSSESYPSDDYCRGLQLQVKNLQEENRRLQQNIFDKHGKTGLNENSNLEHQMKGLIMENVIFAHPTIYDLNWFIWTLINWF